MAHVKSRKLRYFGHVIRIPHDTTECSVKAGLGMELEDETKNRQVGQITTWTRLSGANLLATRDRRHWTALTHPCSNRREAMMT